MHPITKPERQAAFEITTPKQQKAYFHPVRMKILNFLTRERLTISQTAERLKVHPANITHHFRVLQSASLIRLVEERDIGRVIEKYYEAVATVFNIRPPEGAVKSVNRKGLSFLRDDLSASIELLKADDSEDVYGQIWAARIDSKTFLSFAKRLRSLIEEFQNIACTEGKTYALNLSLYPHQLDYGPLGKYELKKQRRIRVVK
jgi:DNA-binding transcriptional ArsR family regulator